MQVISGIFIGVAIGTILMCLLQVNKDNWKDKVIQEQRDEIMIQTWLRDTRDELRCKKCKGEELQ